MLELRTHADSQSKKENNRITLRHRGNDFANKSSTVTRKNAGGETKNEIDGSNETHGTSDKKILATIQLKSKTIIHSIYVVKNDFPISYSGILGNDFIKQYKAVYDHEKEKLIIGKNTIIVYSYQILCRQGARR